MGNISENKNSERTSPKDKATNNNSPNNSRTNDMKQNNSGQMTHNPFAHLLKK